MARNNSSKTARTAPQAQAQGQSEAGGGAGTDNAGDVIEQQVVAFAEQLGRVVGTVQAKAEGWLDPKALSDQVARVRDSAASLLQQIGASTGQKTENTEQNTAQKTEKTEQKTEQKTGQKADRAPAGRSGPAPIATMNRGGKAGGRSGGVVDAPGKKHRKPAPNEAVHVSAADRGRVAKMKAVNANRNRKRGR